jgi:citrate lyase subunit beta/citryl-CoA lyase
MIFLFAPAHEPRKALKAAQSDVDAVIFDLEASVPSDQKGAARAAVNEYLGTLRRPNGPQLWVRVNAALVDFEDDLTAIDWSQPDGVLVARSETCAPLESLRSRGTRCLIPLIESARGFAALADLAEIRGVDSFAIGTWDLLVDLGLLSVADPDESEVIWQLRGQLVVASRQLGLKPPIDGVFARLDNDDGFHRVCERACRLGYRGKLLVHPRQIAAANRIFGPNLDQLRFARQVVDAYQQAVTGGVGVIRVGDVMIDHPMVQQARALLSKWAGALR